MLSKAFIANRILADLRLSWKFMASELEKIRNLDFELIRIHHHKHGEKRFAIEFK